MAVRVRLDLEAGGGTHFEVVAVLNGGFEVRSPHLLLPAICAERLFEDFRGKAIRQMMEAAGGTPEFWLLDDLLLGHVVTLDRAGPQVRFRVLVSDTDPEVLVSDEGIDALGIRIQSFAPGRWRFSDETGVRESEAPQYW